MPPVHMLIKPASSLCNMRCGYCFYRDEAQARACASYGMMARETLEAVVRRAFEAQPSDCLFAFQGGEPTLAGLDFFEEAVRLAQQYNEGRRPVSFAIQTNGLLLDEAWARFFRAHNFLVGLSLDGPAEVHDRFRQDESGKGTFSRTMRAASLLSRAGVDFNVLSVVTAPVARHIAKAYRFFMKNGLAYQQYIPCLDPLGEEPGGHEFSLTSALYGRFLTDLFDLWYEDVRRGVPIYIRYFENLVAMLAGYRPENCGLSGVCAIQHVVEADGGVYPCDFYALDEYRLGSLIDEPLCALDARAEAFLRPSLAVAKECLDCEFYGICRGGCRRDRDLLGEITKNRFCQAYRAFFAHALPRLTALSRAVPAPRR